MHTNVVQVDNAECKGDPDFQREGTNTSPAYIFSQIALDEETIKEPVQVFYNVFIPVIIHGWYESNECKENYFS